MGKNRLYGFIMVGICCLMQCSCSRYPVDGDSEALKGNPDMPEFRCDVDCVEAPAEAAVWSGQWLQWDREKVCAALLRFEPVSEEETGFGRDIHAQNTEGDKEILIVDETNRYREQSGCLSYTLFLDGEADIGDYQDVVSNAVGHDSLEEQFFLYNSRADFQDRELVFAGREETEQGIREIMSACGLPSPMRLFERLALNVDGLNAHREELSESWYHYDTEDAVQEQEYRQRADALREWTAAEEAYRMRYVQTIDDIPLMNHEWLTGFYNNTNMYVDILCNRNGIVYLHVFHAVEPLERQESMPLLTPEEARDRLAEYYKGQSSASEEWVEDMGLYYVVLEHGAELRLQPAWVFCIAQQKISGTGEKAVKVKEYSHIIIDALTGEQISRNTY